eukprot:COSAG02_NODE_403_length_23058_cov_12.124134_18_plen_56_part_00
MPISWLICEKTQRLEVVVEEGCAVFISELFVHHTIPTQPVTLNRVGRGYRIRDRP